MSELPSPESRPLGKSEIVVGPVAWGMWRFRGDDVAHARSLVEAALQAGVTLFDTADIYGPDNGEPFGASEALLGRVFAEAPQLREKMVLATKGGIVIGTPYDSSGGYIASAIDASLHRLGVEQIDLWQIHRPDILTHPAEIARALEDAHRAGKIRAVGVSNYTAAQAAALAAHLSLPLASHQPEFSPLVLGPLFNGLVDQAMAMDMALLAWSPLGGGGLAEPQDTRARAVAGALDVHAERYGVSRTAAALSWLMAHPAGIIPIVGTQTAARIAEIPQALKPRWTRSEWYSVLQISMGERLP
jgi:predicted oxidoreductase